MRDESMLQALESTADQVDRLAEIIDEFLTMVGGDGNRSEALPHDRLLAILRRYNRLVD